MQYPPLRLSREWINHGAPFTASGTQSVESVVKDLGRWIYNVNIRTRSLPGRFRRSRNIRSLPFLPYIFLGLAFDRPNSTLSNVAPFHRGHSGHAFIDVLCGFLRVTIGSSLNSLFQFLDHRRLYPSV